MFEFRDNIDEGCDSAVDPEVEFTYPESLQVLPDATYEFVVEYDFNGAELNDPIEEVDLQFSFTLSPETDGRSVVANLEDSGLDGSITIGSTPDFNRSLAANCIANDGVVTGNLSFFAYNTKTMAWIYSHPVQPVDIDCSVLVTPVAPSAPLNVCGPDNDIISIHDQPAGVTVAEGEWAEGRRTITYTRADWAIFPADFDPVFEFTDDQHCDAAASITGPTTLYRLEPGSQLEITGDYDVSSLWPEGGSLEARIEGSFQTERIGRSFELPLPISTPAGSFAITFEGLDGWLAELCPDPDYTGDLEIFFDIVFYQQTGPNTYETVWMYAQTLDIPCTVALTPLDASIANDICGHIDERIIVPQQVGITGHTISWADNVATITYETENAYEIVGGPYTLTVDPCIATPIPPDAPVAVCGANNDILAIPTQPEGVILEDSGWVENERIIEFITDEGYVFPENTTRLFTFTDENIACEEDSIGTTLVVTFETSDGESIEGAPYSLYAPVASQAMQEPFIEGEIGPGNQIVIDELIAGTYRLATSPEGYEPIDVTFEVLANEASEQQVIAVAALQPTGTPTPEPTVEPTTEPTVEPTSEPTVEPTTEPTVEPTVSATPTQLPADPTPAPTEEISPVTGLPETGSGSGGGFGIFALAGLFAAMVLGASWLTGKNRRT